MKQRLSKLLMVLHIMCLPISSPYEQRNLHKGHTIFWRKFFAMEPQNRIRELQNSCWKAPQEFSCLTSSPKQGQLELKAFSIPTLKNSMTEGNFLSQFLASIIEQKVLSPFQGYWCCSSGIPLINIQAECNTLTTTLRIWSLKQSLKSFIPQHI